MGAPLLSCCIEVRNSTIGCFIYHFVLLPLEARLAFRLHRGGSKRITTIYTFMLLTNRLICTLYVYNPRHRMTFYANYFVCNVRTLSVRFMCTPRVCVPCVRHWDRVPCLRDLISVQYKCTLHRCHVSGVGSVVTWRAFCVSFVYKPHANMSFTNLVYTVHMGVLEVMYHTSYVLHQLTSGYYMYILC